MNHTMKKKSKHAQSTSRKLRRLTNALYDDNIQLIFIAGIPSCGKTKSVMEAAAEQVFSGGSKYQKIVLCRPVIIPKTGFLPGSLEEKMKPYTKQAEIYMDKVLLPSDERFEIVSVDLLQGNRYQDCFVVFDEMQNIPWEETFKVLSRRGENSKYIIIGDMSMGQANTKVAPKDSMLYYAIQLFAKESYASVHLFYDENDVLGDEITKKMIKKMLPDFVGDLDELKSLMNDIEKDYLYEEEYDMPYTKCVAKKDKNHINYTKR